MPVAGRRSRACEKHDFFEGLDSGDLEVLGRQLERRDFDTRRPVVRKSEPADDLFVLVRAELSALIDTPSGRLRRLSTLSPGLGFGERKLLRNLLASMSRIFERLSHEALAEDA